MKLFCIIICLSIISLTNSVAIVDRRLVYYFNVSYAANSSSIVLINNQMPGSLIQAELNDILVIHVTNSLPGSEKLAIHFYDLLVQQTPQMDGVAYITQMPILSGHTFTHVLHAYPAGTYFYHSHAGLQSVTAFGGVVINDRQNPWNALEVSTGPFFFGLYLSAK